MKSSARASLASLFCGAGKTEIFIDILSKSQDKRSLVLLNKLELLDQTVRRIGSDKVNIFCGSRKKDAGESAITVGTIQSILNKKDAQFDQIFLDEVHGVNWEAAESNYYKLVNRFSQAKIFGFTATPFRENGLIYGPGKLFKEITYEKNIKEGVEEGWLVSPVLKGSPLQFDTSKLRISMGEYDQKDVAKLVSNSSKQVADAYKKTLDRKKIVWFCSNIEHAEKVKEEIPEDSAIIHSKLSNLERGMNKNKFENSACRHLVFVTIVAEGYDYPPIDSIVMLRPTRSATLYVQVAGRGLRIHPGKKDCLILDYGRVIEKLGPLDNPVIESPKKRKKGEPPLEPPMKMCSGCFQMIPSAANACTICKWEFPKKEKVLSRKPEETRPILSSVSTKETFEAEIFKAVFSQHISKNGNDGFKVEYFENFFTSHIEYLTKQHWNMKNIMTRMDQLQIKSGDQMPIERKFDPPKKILFQRKDGWITLKEFERAGHRDSNSNVGKPTAGSLPF